MTNLKKLLEMALRSEIDARDIYENAAKTVKNSLLKEKFNFLSNEEAKHKIMIENIIKMKFPNEKIEIPNSTEVPLPKISIKEGSPISELLTQAMKSEMETSKFYEEISKQLDDENASLMKYLSAIEMSHYYFLQAERDLALKFENYDQYFEMMHIGP